MPQRVYLIKDQAGQVTETLPASLFSADEAAAAGRKAGGGAKSSIDMAPFKLETSDSYVLKVGDFVVLFKSPGHRKEWVENLGTWGQTTNIIVADGYAGKTLKAVADDTARADCCLAITLER